MSDELELKYSAADLPALEAFVDEHFPAAGEYPGWHQYKTTDRVFDTDGGALLEAGYGARLRRIRGQTTLGLKSDVAVERGLHHRRELEAPASDSLQPHEWPPSEPRDIVRTLAGDVPLRERFVLRQWRGEREWRGADGGTCLFTLDRVEVRHRRQRLSELRQLEVELREGEAGILRAIDATLMGSGLVRHEPRSKMALAGALVRASAPLDGDEPFGGAGRRVLRRHLERMIEREADVRAGDPLALKQMRVATRRMRATWRLFEGAYEARAGRRYVRELRRVARRLGAVREMDVLLETLPADAALESLAKAWRERRAQAWTRLLAVFDSARYGQFVDDYRTFTDGAGEGQSELGSMRVRDLAGSRMWAAYEHVRAYEPRLTEPDVATLHALRIHGKRLRYALETFAPLLGKGVSTELLPRLTRMQDHLGALNDADIAARAGRDWLATEAFGASAGTRRAVRSYVARREADVQRLQAGFARAWRPVAGVPFRRRLGLALSAI